MTAKILVTLSVLIFTIVIPILEINASHVFNASWPAHARFHEVWQLTTNCGIGVLCLWLAWLKNQVPPASVLIILVMGGALFSHGIESIYGGSILSGNSTMTILGMQLGAAGASLTIVMAVLASILNARFKPKPI